MSKKTNKIIRNLLENQKKFLNFFKSGPLKDKIVVDEYEELTEEEKEIEKANLGTFSDYVFPIVRAAFPTSVMGAFPNTNDSNMILLDAGITAI